MEFNSTEIPGVYLIKPFYHEDERGTFVKTFNRNQFEDRGFEYDFRESFYSESVKGVIRGMHFQLPPHDHAKLVFSMSGEILDVLLDLRRSSPQFGKYQSFQLSYSNRQMLYIPRGIAHGFCSITDRATLFYFTTSVHVPESDSGIKYDSFGFDWPVQYPIVSPRDQSFESFSDFETVF